VKLDRMMMVAVAVVVLILAGMSALDRLGWTLAFANVALAVVVVLVLLVLDAVAVQWKLFLPHASASDTKSIAPWMHTAAHCILSLTPSSH